MELSAEFYENITSEQIEENVEFIDWLMVPEYLITEEIKTKFSSINTLRAMIWFKDVLNHIEFKKDVEKYTETSLFLFLGRELYMCFDEENNRLFCIEERICKVLKDEYGYDYTKDEEEIKRLVKFLVEQKFNHIVVTYIQYLPLPQAEVFNVEMHFNSI